MKHSEAERGTERARPPVEARGTAERGTKMGRLPSRCERANAELFRLDAERRRLETAIDMLTGTLEMVRSEPLSRRCWGRTPHGVRELDCAQLRQVELLRRETELESLRAELNRIDVAIARTQAEIRRECYDIVPPPPP